MDLFIQRCQNVSFLSSAGHRSGSLTSHSGLRRAGKSVGEAGLGQVDADAASQLMLCRQLPVWSELLGPGAGSPGRGIVAGVLTPAR